MGLEGADAAAGVAAGAGVVDAAFSVDAGLLDEEPSPEAGFARESLR